MTETQWLKLNIWFVGKPVMYHNDQSYTDYGTIRRIHKDGDVEIRPDGGDYIIFRDAKDVAMAVCSEVHSLSELFEVVLS